MAQTPQAGAFFCAGLYSPMTVMRIHRSQWLRNTGKRPWFGRLRSSAGIVKGAVQRRRDLAIERLASIRHADARVEKSARAFPFHPTHLRLSCPLSLSGRLNVPERQAGEKHGHPARARKPPSLRRSIRFHRSRWIRFRRRRPIPCPRRPSPSPSPSPSRFSKRCRQPRRDRPGRSRGSGPDRAVWRRPRPMRQAGG